MLLAHYKFILLLLLLLSNISFFNPFTAKCEFDKMQKTCKSCSVRQNPKVTLVAEVFGEAANKTSGNGGTESHFHAVDSCQICHLSNYTINQSPGCYQDSSNQERGSFADPLKSYWCGTISQLITVVRGFLSLPRNRKKKNSGTLGNLSTDTF